MVLLLHYCCTIVVLLLYYCCCTTVVLLLYYCSILYYCSVHPLMRMVVLVIVFFRGRLPPSVKKAIVATTPRCRILEIGLGFGRKLRSESFEIQVWIFWKFAFFIRTATVVAKTTLTWFVLGYSTRTTCG